ncbi:MAG: alpha/beta hydrolase [Thermoleophilaceae bacterium]
MGLHPCVVMGHGFSSVREHRLDAYAERFAAAGVAVLVFDYRHFGSSAGEPRQLLNVGRQLDDWRAAVSHARNLARGRPAPRGRLGLVVQRRPRGRDRRRGSRDRRRRLAGSLHHRHVRDRRRRRGPGGEADDGRPARRPATPCWAALRTTCPPWGRRARWP